MQHRPVSQMRLIVSYFSNCDDVQLCWRTLDSNGADAPISGCIGFMIERRRFNEGQWSQIEILRNRVGFVQNVVDEDNAKEITQPSNIWPFQRYDWTEHGADANQTVKYRISALAKPENVELGKGPLEVILTSPWTRALKLSSSVDKNFDVFFNRGALMSQFVSRIARTNNWTASELKDHARELDTPLRTFLSGELRYGLLGILNEVKANQSLTLFAALFELGDPELIEGLCQIGALANVILSDGANSKQQEHGPTLYVDENMEARKTLRDAGVLVTDRILGKQGLGHNKILIVVNEDTKQPVYALTGSTNWTASGLCTQLNNAILIRDTKSAQVMLSYWEKLRDAGNDFDTQLMDFNNSSPHRVRNTDFWFTRVAKVSKKETPADIAFIKQLVDTATKSIQYVMFQPGSEPLVSIVALSKKKDLYVRGVVSTIIKSNKAQLDRVQEEFKLVDEGSSRPYTTDLIQPEGIRQDFSYWVEEVTRQGFIPRIGYAITHTKMIVIDAFTDNPIVITARITFLQAQVRTTTRIL